MQFGKLLQLQYLSQRLEVNIFYDIFFRIEQLWVGRAHTHTHLILHYFLIFLEHCMYLAIRFLWLAGCSPHIFSNGKCYANSHATFLKYHQYTVHFKHAHYNCTPAVWGFNFQFSIPLLLVVLMAQDNNFWRGVFKFYSKHQHKLDDLVAAGEWNTW